MEKNRLAAFVLIVVFALSGCEKLARRTSSLKPRTSGTTFSAMPAPTHLKYFGYWNDSGEKTVGLSNYVTLLFQGTTEEARQTEVRALERAAAEGRKVVIWVVGMLISHGPNPQGQVTYFTTPNAAANWQNFAEVIRPYLDNILAFYLVDEPDCVAGGRGVNFFNPVLEQAAATIHADFPGKPVAFNYCNVHAETVIPAGVDWVGLEVYGPIPSDGGPLKTLKTQMRADQKLLLLAPSYTVDGGSPPSEDYDVDVATRLMQYAIGDEQVIGFLVFCFYSDYSDPSAKLRGANELPKVKEKYREIFQSIVAGSGLATQPPASAPTVVPPPAAVPPPAPAPQTPPTPGIFEYQVTVRNSPRTADQMCQELGFGSAADATGYYHKQCAGPLVLSCSGLKCDIDPGCDCSGCGTFWSTWDRIVVSGGGQTVYNAEGYGYDRSGYNPGFYVRLSCR